MEYKLNAYRVCVDLAPGLYRFETDSATGKTRLYHMLEDMWMNGIPVYSYTYKDFKRGVDLLEGVRKCNAELVMIDRADKYITHIVDSVKSIPKTCIVLADHKRVRAPLQYASRVDIEMPNDREVIVSC